MTTEDEAVQATREGLKAAGVPLDADGRVVPVSGKLAKIAEEGGGVLDAETAMAWSVQVEAGEQALIDIARKIVETGNIVKMAPPLAEVAFSAFQKAAVNLLARAVPQFIYGLSTQDIMSAARPLMDFRQAEEAQSKLEGLDDPVDEDKS